MDWNDLRYVLAIARSGSLAGAARTLRVNHSTVFRRLNACEEHLRVRLFDRLPTGYSPTSAGERLLARAERVAAEFDGIGREIDGRDGRLSGSVRLTTAPNLARHYLADYLASFRERHPDIRVSLGVSAENRNLTRREADVALRATSAPPEHLVGRRVAAFPWWVCAGESWLADHTPPPDMNALARCPIIAADDGMSHLPAFRWADRHLPDDTIVARSDDLDAMAALAIAGVGLALLPQDLVMPGLVRLFPLHPPVRTELWLLTHPDLRGVPRIATIMDFLGDSLRADPRLAPAN
jgi:DNA-binding transcriptional LysR family regulator